MTKRVTKAESVISLGTNDRQTERLAPFISTELNTKARVRGPYICVWLIDYVSILSCCRKSILYNISNFLLSFTFLQR